MVKILSRSIFLLLLAVLFVRVSWTLAHKSRSADLVRNFYAQTDRADDYEVLAFGPSYVYCALSPLAMYRDTGLHSFDLATPNQMIEETYYFIRRALRDHHPQVIIVSADMTASSVGRRPHQNGLAHEATDGFPVGPDWLGMLADLDAEGQIDEFVFPFLKYHSRWKNLGRADFQPDANQYLAHRGYRMFVENRHVKGGVRYELDGLERRPVLERHLRWIERIESLARGHGVAVVWLIACPRRNGELQGRIASLHDFMRERGYTLLDLNLEYQATGVDGRDFYDDGHHNVFGAEKISRFTGNWLLKRFPIRVNSDPEIRERWNRDLAKYEQDRREALKRLSGRR